MQFHNIASDNFRIFNNCFMHVTDTVCKDTVKINTILYKLSSISNAVPRNQPEFRAVLKKYIS